MRRIKLRVVEHRDFLSQERKFQGALHCVLSFKNAGKKRLKKLF